MTFFESQDRAHQNTQKLVFVFILSIGVIVVSLYGAIFLTIMIASKGKIPLAWWDINAFLRVAIPTVLIICTGTLFKLWQLRQGGKAIALELGGTRIYSDTKKPQERQLVNVVEEMALAAGISAPAVYVLEGENSINAFAAGLSPQDAVIGVTKGCLESLDRDELQGVIAHEFSHILNGDMRLNLRVVGVLHGILLIYVCGRLLLEINPRIWDDNRKFNAWLFLALAVMTIGSVGLLCGRLIKSAISRQREFLADASAVQFTRNPSGIASALEKISNHNNRSLISSPYAESNSHLFFGSALSFSLFNDWFATHPPLEKRIHRLAAFRGKYRSSQASFKTTEKLAPAGGIISATPSSNPSSKPAVNQALINKFSPSIQAGVKEQKAAIAIAYSLFLDKENSSLREQQISWLKQNQSQEIANNIEEYKEEVLQIEPKLRIIFLELLQPQLAKFSSAQCQHFLKSITSLIKIKNQWQPADFALYVVLCHRLESCLKLPPQQPGQYTTIKEIWTDCIILFSAIAKAGNKTETTSNYLFRTGMTRLAGINPETIPKTVVVFKLNDLHNSLKRLRYATPKLKQTLLESLSYTVLLENNVNEEEADLLRVISIMFDCPFPQFLNR